MVLAPLILCLADTSHLELRHTVVAEINALRVARNLPPLKADPALMDEVQRNPNDGSPLKATGARSPKVIAASYGEAIYDIGWTAVGIGTSTDINGSSTVSLRAKAGSFPTYAVINQDRLVAYHPEVSVRVVTPNLTRSVEFSVNESAYAPLPVRNGVGTLNLPRGTGLKIVYFRIQDSRGKWTTEADSIYLQDCTLWPDPVVAPPTGSQLGPPVFDPLQFEKSPGVFEFPLTFPVFGKVSWTDTWGASRGGGTRKHIGQDLPAEKLRHILAATDGRFTGGSVTSNGVNCTYIHLNNDTPGTDDGKGGNTYLYAPGIFPGMDVRAGMHIAYNGDSGNAENTISHLHFELHLPTLGAVNAAPSLKAARVETAPTYVVDEPKWLPERGEKRWDVKISKLSEDLRTASIIVAAEYDCKGNAKPLIKFVERTVDLGDLWEPLEQDDFVAIHGVDAGGTKPIRVARLKILRKPKLGRTSR
ncbi:MAG TPA: hypothetical protein VK171_01375 [Fimbriimonas sp.]|nr:hypothetical protein [Fimbriimonas sp.]